MCALPMSVLGGPRWILCEEAVLWLTVVGADGGGTRCAYMCGLPMSVPGGSHRIRCEEAVLQLTVAGSDGGGGVRTYAPYLCRFR
jgi:hypothetical protein